MFGDIGIDIIVKKMTEDVNHPAPWRWYFATDTPVGYLTDEGLSPTEEEAVEDAGNAFCKAVQDKDTQTRTSHFVRIEISLDEVLALAEDDDEQE